MAADNTIITGANQPAIVAAVLPANPSRDKTAAAVQLGTAAAAPNIAPKKLVAPLRTVVFRSFTWVIFLGGIERS
jgi:hypothetical protein